jgi:hypothetical protein
MAVLMESDIRVIAESNASVDLHLLLRSRELAASLPELPPGTKGAQFSLNRGLSQRSASVENLTRVVLLNRQPSARK